MSVQCVDERAALHEGGPHGIGAERERQRDRERERERDREREREKERESLARLAASLPHTAHRASLYTAVHKRPDDQIRTTQSKLLWLLKFRITICAEGSTDSAQANADAYSLSLT